ncbi:MAG: hypothetical protein HXS46_10630 [Theionarchaea archaeon]|nr:MAG: hypothetical protein AYK18_16065 [Theionarchaea archaeon DG-70]MBU7011137.1 hypothetical protein [Theionarchaea archaeon]
MKLALWHTERERTLVVFCIFISLACIILIFAILYDRDTWKEDVDGDGVDEIVEETHLFGGRYLRTITQEDGTLYQTEHNRQGDITHEWKMVLNSDRKTYTIYVWDKGKEEWLLDQNQNGISDKDEQ